MTTQISFSQIIRAISLALAAGGVGARWASAAIVLGGVTTYEQDFDFLRDNDSFVEWDDDAATETETGSPGWLWQWHTTDPTPPLFYDAGTPNLNVGRAYALGTGDQAMGSLNGDFVLAATWGVVFQNNTGQTINSVTVTYFGEQWRRATLADSLVFSYRTSPTLIGDLVPTQASPMGWTAHSALDFQAPDVGTDRMQVDGNDAVHRAVRTSTLPISAAHGEYFALRWYDTDGVLRRGAAMGIDDLNVSFTVAAVPETSAWLLVGVTSILAIAWSYWRHKRRRSQVHRSET